MVGLDSIRLKFIGSLGKFDNLDNFDTPTTEYQSKINAQEETPRIDPEDAFGNSSDDDMPF